VWIGFWRLAQINKYLITQLLTSVNRYRSHGEHHKACHPGMHCLRLDLLSDPQAHEQYFGEIGQPQRTNFIARRLSYHGNSLGALALADHPGRRAPYEPFLDNQHFHHVSPAYAKRFQKPGETEEEYIERLRQELEDKFIALGPDTVIGCEYCLA
jgi:4-aminobutyrate aminotransferase-like enzyme